MTQYDRLKETTVSPADLLSRQMQPGGSRLDRLHFMHYRLFQPEDFHDLYAIEEVCFHPPQRFTRRYMRQLLASTEAATWIAEQNGTLPGTPGDTPSSLAQMSGFAIVEWSQQLAGVVAYIATIEVLPAYRRFGIGAELLRRVEGSANAERAIEIWLHVDTENAPAIRLYERSGYQKAGRADHYYARNRPAVIYVKYLV